MSVHADRWIRRLALERRMIEPFEEKLVRRAGDAPVISYGLSSYGYDLRVADEFKVFTNVFNAVVDPKAFDDRSFVDIQGESCLVPPNSFALARSVEYFRIPRDVLTLCVGKSTYARCGIIVNVTPLEPEWEGHVTLEISNTTPPAGPHLRGRGAGASALSGRSGALRDELRRPRREISGAARHYRAAYVNLGSTAAMLHITNSSFPGLATIFRVGCLCAFL
jgi:dCTP deaminase